MEKRLKARVYQSEGFRSNLAILSFMQVFTKEVLVVLDFLIEKRAVVDYMQRMRVFCIHPSAVSGVQNYFKADHRL